MYTYQRGNNFDILKLFLAINVMIYHIGILSGNKTLFSISSFINGETMVDVFFIISGFFIFMSYEKSKSLNSYFVKRFRRIYPAYAFVVIFFSIVLFFLSTKNLENYFSIAYFKYLFYNLLFLNFMSPNLPGLFEHNFLHAVNGSLWSLKVEVMFYLSVPFIVWIFMKTKRIYTIGVIYLLSLIYKISISYYIEQTGNNAYSVLLTQLPAQLVFFMSGALFYYYFNFIDKYKNIILPFGIIGFFLAIFFGIDSLYPLFLSVVTMTFALFIPFLGHIGKYGDFSYGIYIVHFPIIQCYSMLGYFDKHPYITFLSVIITSFTLAYFIWHFIEKPFLQKKSHYVQELQNN